MYPVNQNTNTQASIAPVFNYSNLDSFALHSAIKQKKNLSEILPLINSKTVNQKDWHQDTPPGLPLRQMLQN